MTQQRRARRRVRLRHRSILSVLFGTILGTEFNNPGISKEELEAELLKRKPAEDELDSFIEMRQAQKLQGSLPEVASTEADGGDGLGDINLTP